MDVVRLVGCLRSSVFVVVLAGGGACGSVAVPWSFGLLVHSGPQDKAACCSRPNNKNTLLGVLPVTLSQRDSADSRGLESSRDGVIPRVL